MDLHEHMEISYYIRMAIVTSIRVYFGDIDSCVHQNADNTQSVGRWASIYAVYIMIYNT